MFGDNGCSYNCQPQVSWGLGCARPGVYGIYTEVDRKLNDNGCKVSYDASLLEGVRCPFSLKGQSHNNQFFDENFFCFKQLVVVSLSLYFADYLSWIATTLTAEEGRTVTVESIGCV